ncbi:MAG: hypothetical protein ACOYBP_06810 [Microbacteriaceae bacterium]
MRSTLWFISGFFALLGTLIALAPASAAPAPDGWSGGGSTNGSTAQLWAQYQQQVAGSSGASAGSSGSSATMTAQQLWWRATWERLFATPSCASYGTCAPAPVAATAPMPRAVTLSDVASFSPDTPGLQSEPMGWTIRGAETNFMVSTTSHTRDGRLLGRSAQVRFTPVSTRLEYGDGAARETADFGAGWRALGLVDFSATSTSHRYGAAGRYSVSAAVTYRVEYRFGSADWTVIAGTVSNESSQVLMTVFEARNALVEHICTEPRATGC